jgi:hypothetical protein
MAARRLLAGLVIASALVACAAPDASTVPRGDAGREADRGPVVAPQGTPAGPAAAAPPEEPAAERADEPAPASSTAAPRPAWLGTRVLPIAADGFGERLPTPAELVDRRLVTPPLPDPAPPAATDGTFAASVTAVPAGVLARSTWRPECPVAVDELRYVTVRFVGFDDLVHTGELIVHADVAEDVVVVFSLLHAARFPLEEVRVIAAEELDAPPTGDGNVTSGFVCRPTVGGSRWSEHAYGRAIDLNPFHNPYVRGDLVIPELAGSYVDRSDVRPGMVLAGDVVTQAFGAVGWAWGGDWTGRATDPMHFSVSGR